MMSGEHGKLVLERGHCCDVQETTPSKLEIDDLLLRGGARFFSAMAISSPWPYGVRNLLTRDP